MGVRCPPSVKMIARRLAYSELQQMSQDDETGAAMLFAYFFRSFAGSIGEESTNVIDISLFVGNVVTIASFQPDKIGRLIHNLLRSIQNISSVR